MDAIDFERRLWVPHSGWPFNQVHLEPCYRQDQLLFELGPYTYEVDLVRDMDYYSAKSMSKRFGGKITDLSKHTSLDVAEPGVVN